MLGLNETQEGVLHLVFRIADERGLLLLDAKDLRAMLQFVGDNARDFTTEYGNVSSASIGAIQRSMLALADQGGDRFFGEPMLNLDDMMQTDAKGRGVLNILAADRLLNAPRLYGSFLLWLLSDLFERLPEVGDRDKPKLVFFFDEAHLLFNEAPRALLEKVEQVVRLIRSKGVGGVQQRAGDHRTGGRRGAGVVPRREGAAGRRRTRLRGAAGVADRADHRGRAQGADRRLGGGRRLRGTGGSRFGL